MRGLVGRLRAPVVPQALCTPSTSTPLDLALRRVTHTDCAAVPSEAVHEVVRLASESEEALAIVLRHVEDNACAPARDWRKINGAIVLLERLINPGPAGGNTPKGAQSKNSRSESLVGRMWYEAKMEDRLKDLDNFHFPEDQRVATLIKRAASATLKAAESKLPVDDVTTSTDITNEIRLESGTQHLGEVPAGGTNMEKMHNGGHEKAGARSSVEQSHSDQSSLAECHRRISPSQKASDESRGVSATAVGRPSLRMDRAGTDEMEAAASAKNANLQNVASALDALRDTGTRWEAPPTPPSSDEEQPITKQSSKKSSPDEASYSFCCCCRRRQRPESTEPPGDNEDDTLLL